MTLPATGALSMNMVATELGADRGNLSLNDARVRALVNVAAPGRMSFSILRGRTANKITVTAGQITHYVSAAPTIVTGFCASFAQTFEDGATESVAFGSRSPTTLLGYGVHGVYTDPQGLVIELSYAGNQSAPASTLLRGVTLRLQGQTQSTITSYAVTEARNGTLISRYRFNSITEKFTNGVTEICAICS